ISGWRRGRRRGRMRLPTSDPAEPVPIMFYRGDQPHGLRHNPFNAIVVPRPIGWISTIDREGRPNLAPYSFFNGVAYTPPQVMFASTSAHRQGGGMKDTVANARDSGEFVVNICTWTLREAMNITAAPS